MSQFDQTTERKAEEHATTNAPEGLLSPPRYYAFRDGRNSAKESLAILARAMKLFVLSGPHVTQEQFDYLIESHEEAIAAVKARGDWPLEETK